MCSFKPSLLDRLQDHGKLTGEMGLQKCYSVKRQRLGKVMSLTLQTDPAALAMIWFSIYA
jgi:hypothetical protein